MADPVTPPPVLRYMQATAQSRARANNSNTQPNGTNTVSQTTRGNGLSQKDARRHVPKKTVPKATTMGSVGSTEASSSSSVVNKALVDSDTISESLTKTSDSDSPRSHKSSGLSRGQSRSRRFQGSPLTQTPGPKGKSIEALIDEKVKLAWRSECQLAKKVEIVIYVRRPKLDQAHNTTAKLKQSLTKQKVRNGVQQQTIEDLGRRIEELENRCATLARENNAQKGEIMDLEMIIREKDDINEQFEKFENMVDELVEGCLQANQENTRLGNQLADATAQLDAAQLSTALEMSEATITPIPPIHEQDPPPGDDILPAVPVVLPTPPSSPSLQPLSNPPAANDCKHDQKYRRPRQNWVRRPEPGSEIKAQVSECGNCRERLYATRLSDLGKVKR